MLFFAVIFCPLEKNTAELEHKEHGNYVEYQISNSSSKPGHTAEDDNCL
jgi:hypothetical protein